MFEGLPVSQLLPRNPSTHVQLYWSILWAQVAPFRQGLLPHSSISKTRKGFLGYVVRFGTTRSADEQKYSSFSTCAAVPPRVARFTGACVTVNAVCAVTRVARVTGAFIDI